MVLKLITFIIFEKQKSTLFCCLLPQDLQFSSHFNLLLGFPCQNKTEIYCPANRKQLLFLIP